jgi:hypothetical protein
MVMIGGELTLEEEFADRGLGVLAGGMKYSKVKG